jgi:chromosomal replication initiator protein
MNTNELWQAVLGELELNLSKANFTTWFKNTYISALNNEQAIISVPNTFTKAWLEKKYSEPILKSLRHLSGGVVKAIGYQVDVRPQARVGLPETFPLSVPPSSGPSSYHSGPSPMTYAPTMTQTMVRQEAPAMAQASYNPESKLNPRYSFDSFIVGKGNELAHAAAEAVAANPGTKYNPLFVYGGVGLGKTHLIQAVGQAVVAKNPNAKVLYSTCEQFTNDFIRAVKSGNAREFKDTYRTVDVLLIDDIQFLTGKDGTQEEFFHTFNALHQANKQIIVTSDRPPKQLAAVEHRLISRFEWGMTVDISSPDLETRIAILETKCKERNYDLDPDIIRHIAATVQSNVRELEGALNKVIAYNQFKNMRPTLENTKQLPQSFGPTQGKKSVTARQVIDTVIGYYDVALQDILGKCREKRLAFPRQIIMYLMREEINSSYPAIGHEIGGRDHTTAMHACNKVRSELENDPKVKKDIDLIKQRLYNA